MAKQRKIIRTEATYFKDGVASENIRNSEKTK